MNLGSGKIFWVLSCPGNSLFHDLEQECFYSFEEAQAAAGRLAADFPGAVFLVLQAVSASYVRLPKPTTYLFADERGTGRMGSRNGAGAPEPVGRGAGGRESDGRGAGWNGSGGREAGWNGAGGREAGWNGANGADIYGDTAEAPAPNFVRLV